MSGAPRAGATAAAPNANPAAAFFQHPVARGFAGLLRAVHRVSPGHAQAWALRLFFTPFPGKRAARRRPVPAPWQARHLPFEGGQLAWWTRSDAIIDAPKVLLLHGWAGDAQQLRALGEALHARGLQAVLLDLPAHGRSDGQRANLPQWVRAVFALTGQLGPWHAVAGHSLGGLALAHAVAKGLPAGRLGLIATAPPPALFLTWFAGGLRVRGLAASALQSRIEVREGVRLQEFEPAWLGPRLRLPCLMLHDESDRTAPFATAQALHASLQAHGSTAQLHRTRDLGHRRLLTDADCLARLAEHLGGDLDRAASRDAASASSASGSEAAEAR